VNIAKTFIRKPVTGYNATQQNIANYKLNKRLLHALRHNPKKYGLTLNGQGWVTLDDLVKGVKINKPKVLELVTELDTVQRYSVIYADTKFVRANYGHGLSVPRIVYEPVAPPEQLYFITNDIQSVFEYGVIPSSRQYVHLCSSIRIAREYFHGNKKKPIGSSPVELQADELYKLGIKFYQANKAIWLTDFIPSGVKVTRKWF
jgi:putative RNA 2'-phosphotransferase